ncbi:MAG: insulinase family protein [Bacteroidales bacterium]|nr:insulinase family protein [Bacteroidales bacterium]
MPHHIVRLRNGLRVIHVETNSPISHFGVLVDIGTRDEPQRTPGLAHFLEHTIFKGTQKRNAYRVISRMEAVGGDLNASTSKEETYFHTSFLSQDYPRAVELLSDILCHSIFPEKEIDKEKTVVMEEISYYKDTPSELIFDDFEGLVFENHPLGRNILGTKQSVKKMTRNDLLGLMSQYYNVHNIVLASVGNISLQRLLKLCERYFGEMELAQEPKLREPFTNYQPHMLRVHKHAVQTNVMMGMPAYAITDDKRVPFLLLTNLLGGQGMNTRLNMSMREKRGLAYTVEANYTSFSDTGLFSVYFGCAAQNTDHCVELVLREAENLRHQKLGSMQLYYAKKQLIGQMALANEAKLNEMLSIGHAALFFEEVDTMEESIREIEALTADDILTVANEILDPDNFTTLIFEHS